MQSGGPQSGKPFWLRLLVGVGRIVAFLLVLDLMLFALFGLLPDAAASQLGVFGVDPTLLAEAQERMGLTGPWYCRLLSHWGNLLQLDFGKSLSGQFDIAEAMAYRLRHSLPLWLGAIGLLVVIPIPLAMAWGSRHLGLVRKGVLYLAHVATVPQFLAAVALFAVAHTVEPCLSDRIAIGTRWTLATLSTALLPLGILFSAAANTFEACAQRRYCDAYLAFGMSWSRIRFLLLRNVLVAVRPMLARLCLGVVVGSVFAELVFGIPGFSAMFVDALRTSDINVMQIWVLLVGSVVLVITALERHWR